MSIGLTDNAVRDALRGRDYRFLIHGRSTTPGRHRRRRGQPERQRTRGRNQPYVILVPGLFGIEEFSHPHRLPPFFRILQREGGPSPGEDGLTYDDFSSGEIFAALRQVSAAIRNQTYLPYPTRLVRIPKGNGRWRELQLLRIIDRVVAKALQLALDDYWRSQLPGIGRSVWQIYAEMQHVIRERRAYVLAIDDIRDCFPSAPISAVMECHHQHISQPDLLWLIETVIRGHEGPEHLTGLDQGSPDSPVAMELLLHTYLDARLGAELQGFPLLLRYVDNLTFVCRNEHEGQQALQVTENILAELGMNLKREDGPPRDIRDSNWNRTVLGLIPRWCNGQLSFSIPEVAFDHLRDGISEAGSSHRPVETVNMVARGWISSVGPALVNRVVPEVVGRVVLTVRDYGFRELSVRDLSRVAQQARKRWLKLCAEYERSGS